LSTRYRLSTAVLAVATVLALVSATPVQLIGQP
jgi:hypothetical protein